MKPILFNTDMVRAILEGIKTVTRRVLKGAGPNWDFVGIEERPCERRIKADGTEYPKELGWAHAVFSAGDGYYDYPMIKVPYRPGDILYVRETWNKLLGDWLYKADQKPGMKNPGKWHPSIHMPREAARIFLRVTDVRVERLQDIDDDGVVAEGLEIGAPFDELWDSTIKPKDRGRYGWEANPWVWVIEFERCEKPEEAAP